MASYDPKAFTRRAFLHNGVVLASSAVTVPFFIQRSATAMAQAAGVGTSTPGVPEERVLVVVQLGGGNDGLNTTPPFGSAEYYRARPGIGIAERDVLRMDRSSGVGLHPRMTDLFDMYEQGRVAVVQGVGYPNPNRSHFRSMDIWQTADTTGVGDGWLGRYFDNECAGSPKDDAADGARAPGIAVGREAPLAMQGRKIKPVSFEDPDQFRWTGERVHDALVAPYDDVMSAGAVEGAPANSNAEFLMRTALDAQVSSDAIRRAVSAAPLAQYPRNELAGQLSMVASMIRAGLQTRVYYTTLGGFDTHAGQGGAQGRHANLLQQFSSSVSAFYKDLEAQGNDGRVLTMVFSEFGRRVGQNASGGTDHGAAAPMFLLGPMVRPGLLGRHPSMTDLDDGDLRFTTDFRNVYACVLDKWLKADANAVLGRRFPRADVLGKV